MFFSGVTLIFLPLPEEEHGFFFFFFFSSSPNPPVDAADCLPPRDFHFRAEKLNDGEWTDFLSSFSFDLPRTAKRPQEGFPIWAAPFSLFFRGGSGDVSLDAVLVKRGRGLFPADQGKRFARKAGKCGSCLSEILGGHGGWP